MGAFGVTLLISVCLHLGSGLNETCKPAECLTCSSPPAPCPACVLTSQNCTSVVPSKCVIKAFNVSVQSSSNSVEKGADVTVNCTHNLPNGTISWTQDDELKTGTNTETLEIKNLFKTTNIKCNVSSVCGSFSSTLTIDPTDPSIMVVLLVCVGAAAAVLMLFALVMKVRLRRGRAQNQARKRQRQQNMENIHSTVNTISSYY